MTFYQARFKYAFVMLIVIMKACKAAHKSAVESSSSCFYKSLHSFTLHLHAAGLSSCSRLIFFPSHSHQIKPITTQTADST